MSEDKNVARHVEHVEQEVTLRRDIKGWQVGMIALGGVIGSCYFLGVGWTISVMGPAVILAYGLVGFIVYGLMIAYGELLVNLPRKGSFVAYTNEFLGGPVSVGFGWAFWFNWVAYVPSEAIAVSIVLNSLIPGNMFMYSIGALAGITILNSLPVSMFARVESTLAMIKVITIVMFILLAFGIWVGLWGDTGFLGSQNIITDPMAGIFENLFPYGGVIIVTLMVTVLVSFQGTEIVGLAASEAQNPDKAIPRACKSVTYRIIGLYLIPILLVILLVPYGEADLENGSIFAYALNMYGLQWAGGILSAVVMIAAFSCANAGLYGTVRCMYGLAVEGLAPKFLLKLSDKGTPRRAVYFTIIPMWMVLMLGYFLPDSNFYAYLLTMSGFTGTLAWVGIIGSQIVFRKRLRQRGYDVTQLKARVKHQWIPWFAMTAQLIGLGALAFDAEMAPVFPLALSAVVGPMVVYVVLKKMGKTRQIIALDPTEKTFDEAFPDLNRKAINE